MPRGAHRRAQTDRRRLAALAVTVAGALMAMLVAPAAPAVAAEVGFVDQTYVGASAPTGEKPQSKLWFNDGLWWGSLFDQATTDFTIWRLDPATQRWSNTGTVVDERASSFMDTVWDGNKLWVATAGPTATNTNQSPRVARYSYSKTSRSYALDAGFPVRIGNGGVEAVVLDEDSTGMVWATYTQASRVWLTHSQGTVTSWSQPYLMPANNGETSLTTDDISAIVAYGGNRIGVMWGNQNNGTMYWASHVDGAADRAWALTAAFSMPEGADDHINLKSLVADDAGQVFAAVKTSLNGPNDPLINLLVLRNNGTWSTHLFGTVSQQHTRAIVMLAPAARRLYMFASAPCCVGGVIYYKSTSLDSISFAPGLGTPFISSSTNLNLNNPTSTKQPVDSSTGLVVMAGDDRTKTYMHNVLTPPSVTAPDTTITSKPPATSSTGSATFAFSSNVSAATFECALDGASWSACTSPTTYPGLADGTHGFAVRAVAGGTVDATSATYSWTVTTAAPRMTGTAPADGATGVRGDVRVTASFSKDMSASSFTTSTVTLASSAAPATPVQAVVAYATASRTVSLQPTAALQPGTRYVAKVLGGASGVKDTGGQPLAADATWSFTAAAAGATTVFADDFSTGDLSRWSVVKAGADGTTGVVGGQARFTATRTAGSFGYARKDLTSGVTDAHVVFDATPVSQGSTGATMTLTKLYNPTGTRVLSLFRVNGSGALRVDVAATVTTTSTVIPLGASVHIDVQVQAATSNVVVLVNGVSAYASTSVPVSPTGVGRVLIGTDNLAQAFTETYGDVTVTTG